MQINYFHVFNRGAHKAEIFHDTADYFRFIKLLYIGNSIKPFEIKRLPKDDFFNIDRKEAIVEIASYCLMPNHFHIVLRELNPGMKTLFMRKICSGYTNYYNIKYRHSGTIFQGKYKSKLVETTDYFKTLLNYVHLNPYGIVSPNLTDDEKQSPEYLKKAIEFSEQYDFSSYKDYLGVRRIQGAVLRMSDIR